MDIKRMVQRGAFVVLLALTIALMNVVMLGEVWGQTFTSPPSENMEIQASEARPRWTVGSTLGLLGQTPDGMALAWNTHADVFVDRQLSIGPLLQTAFTGDLAQVGLSGQMKYWIQPPQPGNSTSVNLQAGVGVLHADAGRSDTSWLVPLGVGVEYALSPHTSLISTFLVDFTDVNLGGGAKADVMPGFSVGIRF